MPRSVLIVGCGFVGLPLARELRFFRLADTRDYSVRDFRGKPSRRVLSRVSPGYHRKEQLWGSSSPQFRRRHSLRQFQARRRRQIRSGLLCRHPKPDRAPWCTDVSSSAVRPRCILRPTARGWTKTLRQIPHEKREESCAAPRIWCLIPVAPSPV